MSTNTIIGIVVGAIVIIGGGYYLMQGDSRPVAEESALETEQQTETGASQEEKFSGSFTELAARTGSWKCTVDTSAAGTVSSGVTYVSDGKVRGDFTTSSEGYKNIETHMVGDGQYVYTWSSMMPQGIKVKMSAQASGDIRETGSASGSSVSADQSYSYNCQPWTADASLFVAPASVNFMMVGQ